MITPDEIKKKADRQFKRFLTDYYLYNKDFFPLRIPADKGSAATNNLKVRRDALEMLWQQSKNKTGRGYTLETEIAATRKNGEQTVITGIYIETEVDYLSLTGRNTEAAVFHESIAALRSAEFCASEAFCSNKFCCRPSIDKWIEAHISLLCTPPTDKYTAVPPEPERYWKDICMCTNWFLRNPNSDLYPREIPLPVHSKYIEENMATIRSLVAFLIGRSLEELPRTLGLRIPDTLIRFRWAKDTDEIRVSLTPQTPAVPQTASFGKQIRLNELSLLVSDFGKLDLSDVVRIIIIENLLVYLTFPPLSDTLCVFGGGFAVTRLAGCQFPETVQLLYFGDLDEHGFAILSDFRSLFPQTKSFCMDMQTLRTFRMFRVPGAVLAGKYTPEHLTEQEQAVFGELRADTAHGRLEQERIAQSYIIERTERLETI